MMRSEDVPSEDDIDALLSSIERTHSRKDDSTPDSIFESLRHDSTVKAERAKSNVPSLHSFSHSDLKSIQILQKVSEVNRTPMRLAESYQAFDSSRSVDILSGRSKFSGYAPKKEQTSARKLSVGTDSPDEEFGKLRSNEVDKKIEALNDLRNRLLHEESAFEKRTNCLLAELKESHVELNERACAIMKQEYDVTALQRALQTKKDQLEKSDEKIEKIESLLGILDDRKNELIKRECRYSELNGGRSLNIPIADRILELKHSAESLRQFVETWTCRADHRY